MFFPGPAESTEPETSGNAVTEETAKTEQPAPAAVDKKEDESDDEEDNSNTADGADKKKKKRKRNKKKGGAASGGPALNSNGQTTPPTIPIADLFPTGNFPIGEIQKYPVDERKAVDRFTSEEKKAIDAAHNDIYNELRHAAEAHRQVNSFVVL